MRNGVFYSVLFCVLLLSGCCSMCRHETKALKSNEPTVLAAVYTAEPINVDGRLDEAIWQKAHEYEMAIPRDKYDLGERQQEWGTVRLAWDEKYFYAAMDFKDSDLVAEGKTDQLLHYSMGDVGELFLKPDDHTWYWELYVTPAGRKTSIFLPGRGRLLVPSCLEYTCGLKVGAQCSGTLNNWQDKDNGWTAEMAMPISDLTARGEKFGPGSKWHILIGRYNYSRYLKTQGPELSSLPRLDKANYHSLEEYGTLVFEK